MSRLWNFFKKNLSSNTIQNATIKMFDSSSNRLNMFSSEHLMY